MNHMPDNVTARDMVEHVPWMVDLDYEILNHLWKHEELESDTGYWTGARAIQKMTDKDRSYISRRLNVLARSPLLQKDGAVYALSETGREFMQGDVPAEDLPEPED